jgi:cytochrome c-type biogenesis protein CcmH/NrfF
MNIRLRNCTGVAMQLMVPCRRTSSDHVRRFVREFWTDSQFTLSKRLRCEKCERLNLCQSRGDAAGGERAGEKGREGLGPTGSC